MFIKVKWNMQNVKTNFMKFRLFLWLYRHFLLSDAFCTYKCYTYSESYGSKEHSSNLTLRSWVEIKTPVILSDLDRTLIWHLLICEILLKRVLGCESLQLHCIISKNLLAKDVSRFVLPIIWRIEHISKYFCIFCCRYFCYC